jgi:hypothetical protein
MSLLWVLVIAVPLIAVIALRRRRVTAHRRYIDTPAWQQEHWHAEHERERIARQRML